MAQKVLVTPHLLDKTSGPHLGPLSQTDLEVIYQPVGFDTIQPGNIEQLLTDDVVAMLASTEPLTREVLQNSSLKIIARLGVGFDSVDIAAATELGIAVTITPGTLEVSVAEQTLAMLLGITRQVIERDKEVRSGVWKREPMPRLAGRTFAMVGCGRIGREVIPRMLGMGMRVLIYDPHLRVDLLPENANVHRTKSLEQVWAEADVVSLHAPCNAETEKLINSETLKKMKSTSILLNTSRGGLVDEVALAEALHQGAIWAAGLDVFQQEPLPLDSPLFGCPNLLMASHMGGLDHDSSRLAGTLSAQCIVDIMHGNWPDACLVNPEVKSRWKWDQP